MRIARLFILINYFAFKKNIKKSLLIINIGIFLSLFASSAALISLFIENKINNSKNLITEYSLEKRTYEDGSVAITQVSSTLDKVMRSQETMGYFFDDIRQTSLGKKLVTKQDLFLPFLEFEEDDEDGNFEDIFIDPEFIKEITNFANKFEGQKKLNYLNLIKNIHKIEENVLSDKQIKEYKKIIYHSNYSEILNEINNKDYHNLESGEIYQQTIALYEKVQLFYEFNNLFEDWYQFHIWSLEDEIIIENNKIINLSGLEKNIIFLTFIFQLAIFVIIQFFEVSSINQEIKKRSKKK